MTDWYLRAVPDGQMAVIVNAPGNGSAYASINSLLTGAQQNELANNNAMVTSVQISPPAAINYKTAPVGTVNGPGQVPAVPPALDTNSGAFPIAANQKPNEIVNCPWADWNIFLQSQSASPVAVSILLGYVFKSNIR